MPAQQPDFARAADFIWRSARLIDRARFAYLFFHGDRETVLAALRAYQNVDGGSATRWNLICGRGFGRDGISSSEAGGSGIRS